MPKYFKISLSSPSLAPTVFWGLFWGLRPEQYQRAENGLPGTCSFWLSTHKSGLPSSEELLMQPSWAGSETLAIGSLLNSNTINTFPAQVGLAWLPTPHSHIFTARVRKQFYIIGGMHMCGLSIRSWQGMAQSLKHWFSTCGPQTIFSWGLQRIDILYIRYLHYNPQQRWN